MKIAAWVPKLQSAVQRKRGDRPRLLIARLLCPTGIALALAFSMWQRSAAGLAAVAAKALSLISGAMLLFLVYNIAAGGNPPKKDGAEEDPLAPVEEMVTVPLSPQN